MATGAPESGAVASAAAVAPRRSGTSASTGPTWREAALDPSHGMAVPAPDNPLASQWATRLAQTQQWADQDIRHRCMTPVYTSYTGQTLSPGGGGSSHSAAAAAAAAVAAKPPGLVLFDHGMELLDQFSYVRSADQRRFHDGFMATLAPHILKDDYLCLREEILARFNRRTQSMATFILCPRRWGKSTSVAMAMAVLLRICRGINFVIFSTGEDCSSALLQMIKDFLLQLPGSKERIVVNRRDLLATLPADAAEGTNVNSAESKSRLTNNSIMARTGNVTGNRGITADCFILEEAAYIPQAILTQIIAPMLKVSNSCLIGLSTHAGKENYFSKLFDKPGIEKQAVLVRINLVCDDCQKRGRDPSQCTHMAGTNPSWLANSNPERVKLLMGDDEESYAREVLGAFWSNSSSVFQRDWLAALQDRPVRSVRYPRNSFVLTMIDPAGGGSSSTAICSVLREPDGTLVLLGLAEAQVLEGPGQRQFVQRYMQHFARDAVLARMVHFVAVERNYGGSLGAHSFVELAREVAPSVEEYQPDGLEKHGVWTGPDTNKGGGHSLCWALHDNKVHFGAYLATHHPFVLPGADAAATTRYAAQVDTLKKELLTQLGNFTKKYKPSGSWTYTGKSDANTRDDMAMCLLLAVYHSLMLVREQTTASAAVVAKSGTTRRQ